MNICLIICSPYPPYQHGGVGSFAVDLAEGVVREGHQITVVSLTPRTLLQSDKPVIENINGVKIIRVPSQHWNYPKRIQAILDRFYLSSLVRKLHHESPFDLIECEDGQGMLAFGRLPNIPRIVRLHASSIYNDYVLKRKPSRLNHIFEILWIRRSNFIIAVSEYVGNTTLKLIRSQSERKYKVIHYAIDTEFFKPDPSIKVQAGLILFTGVVAPRKGVLLLIQAMNLVFAKHDNAHLLIVGDDKYPSEDSPFSGEIIKHLEKKYMNRVCFAGVQPRSDLPALIQTAEICCFPSHVETFGIGIAEAMALEKPVIYMKTGPGPEVIEDGISGILCDTFDPVDIADNILFALNNNELVKKLGKKARERVLEKFEKNKWVKENLEYYQKCIDDFALTLKA